MGIIAFKKVGSEDNVSFEISRLVYAVDVRKDGNAEIIIEGMVTAGHDSDPFNAIEMMIPHNSKSQQEILDLIDRTDTFLDEKIKENTYRSAYKIIDKDNRLVNLSGRDVKVVPVDLKKEERHEYVSIFVNFREPLKSDETKAFRLTYYVKRFAPRNSSKFYGFENFTIDMGFYDRSMIEHGNSILNNGSKVVNCKRIYIRCAFPVNFEPLEATPPPLIQLKWEEAFLSRGRIDYPKTLLSWEFDEFSPWMFRNRLSIRLRRRFLGMMDLLSLIAFAIAAILGVKEVISLIGGP